MARLTIEECWWTDPRRSALIRLLSSEEQADYVAIRAWRLAQEFWKHGRKLVPKSLFDMLPGSKELLQVGLADYPEDGFIYVRGSSAYLDWVREKREQAKEAGKKSAEARRKKNGTAQPVTRKSAKSSERNPNELRTESNDAEPSDSVSDSVSGFGFDSENSVRSETKNNTGVVIATYCREWRARYGSRPGVMPKDRGIAKRLTEGLGTDRAASLVESYLRMNNAWFITKRHDLATLEQNLNAVVQFHDTGVQVSQTEARHADSLSFHENQLKRIAEGKL